MSDEFYCYPPDFKILINKLAIRDRAALQRRESELVTQRIAEGVPYGDFDLAHLQAIHRHLFQDVYDWAGKIRTIEISKGGDQFSPVENIQYAMDVVHGRIKDLDYLRNQSVTKFSQNAGELIGTVNRVHPFREGNGRTQLLFLKQLAEQAGHTFHLEKINRGEWIEVSAHAHNGEYWAMAECIEGAITPELDPAEKNDSEPEC